MKKIALFVFAAIISFNCAFAQNSNAWQHQIGIELGIQTPQNELKNLIDLVPGYGFAGTYYYQLDDKNMFLSGSLGYTSHHSDLYDDAFTSMYLSAGVKYNFDISNIQPYVGGELGYYIFSNPSNFQIEQTNSLGLIIKGGVRIPINATLDFDTNFKLHKILSDVNWGNLGVNMGLSMALGE